MKLFVSRDSRQVLLSTLFLTTFRTSMAVPFEAPLPYGVGHFPGSMSVGDLNKDGVPDIITTSETDRTVSVLLGQGGGVFSAAVLYATRNKPVGSVVGDFNRDGYPDVATANHQDTTVTVLSGDGTGSLGAPKEYVIGPSWREPSWIGAGNLNGDNLPDLVILAAPMVVVLVGTLEGTFATHGTYPVAFGLERGLLADLDANGRLDLAATNALRDDVSVLLGDGSGLLGPAASYAAGKRPEGIVALDANRDGTLDLVTANRGSDSVSVLLGGGDGSFAPPTEYEANQTPEALAQGDFDGDCIADLVVASRAAGGIVSTLTGDGAGSFRPPQAVLGGAIAAAIVAVDLNADTRADVAFAASPPAAAWVLDNASVPVCSQFIVRRSTDPATVRVAPPHAVENVSFFEDDPGTHSDGRSYFYLVERGDEHPLVLSVSADRERDTISLGF